MPASSAAVCLPNWAHAKQNLKDPMTWPQYHKWIMLSTVSLLSTDQNAVWIASDSAHFGVDDATSRLPVYFVAVCVFLAAQSATWPPRYWGRYGQPSIEWFRRSMPSADRRMYLPSGTRLLSISSFFLSVDVHVRHNVRSSSLVLSRNAVISRDAGEGNSPSHRAVEMCSEIQ